MSDESGKEKSTLRELLEEGPVDPRIMAKLDLLEELKDAVARKDAKAMLEIGKRLRTNAQEIQAADVERRHSVDAAVAAARAVSDPDERTTKLLEAFEFCAKLRIVAYDEAADIPSGNAASFALTAIAAELDAIPPGRRLALVPFLDNPDVGIRVAVALHLQRTMPDRVLPILQEIKKSDHGSAHWTAFWALPLHETTPTPSSNRDQKKS